MDEVSLLDQLKSLYEIATRFENASSALEKAQSSLERALAFVPTRLSSFDARKKEEFIRSKAGDRPKKGSALLPWNHLKKKKIAFEKAVQEYEDRRDEAEQEYYGTYEEKRQALDAEDKKEKESAIASAEQALDIAEHELHASEELWRADTFLSEALRHTHAIGMMIRFMEEGRASTKQEVINLYYEEEYRAEEARKAEEHRRTIEALIKAQNERLESVASQVSDAVSPAEEALSLARNASDRAEEALSLARSSGSQLD